jgi:hypothetical protein
MLEVLIDTNVILRLFDTTSAPEQTAKVKRLFEAARAEKIGLARSVGRLSLLANTRQKDVESRQSMPFSLWRIRKQASAFAFKNRLGIHDR